MLVFGASPTVLAAAETLADVAPAGLEEVIVTAQKREQSINSVGLSIQAIDSRQLQDLNIRGPQDLVKIVPGLTFTPSPYATPVYTLRGVGLYDSGLASAPSVMVYIDEVPLPYPMMTKGAGLDIERVEVLKGPQGTLFGGSSTGGAINYIAAKPTRDFQAGTLVSGSHFGQVDAEGFVSGPLTDKLTARLAVRAEEGGAWQESTSRNDSLGDAGFFTSRLLLDYEATDRVQLSLNLNGYIDRSDPTAPSLIKVAPFNPALVAPGFTSSVPARDARDADWPAGQPSQDNTFFQSALRAEVAVAEDVTLTSISSFQRVDVDQHLPFSGTPLPYQNIRGSGHVAAFDQEVRLAGQSGNLNWLAGLSYEHVDSEDVLNYDQTLVTNRQPIPSIPAYHDVATNVSQRSETYAAFANLDYQITEAFSVRGGLRFTDDRKDGRACGYDPAPEDGLGTLFEALQFAVKGSFVPVLPGDCLSLDSQFNPASVRLRLDQDNVSWRGGMDYRLEAGTLLYLTVSRGYKAGILPNVAASRTAQYDPAIQEKLDAYEVGVKAPLFDNRLQLNGAAFYYDYTDKQIRGTVLDPVFGKLEKEINIPASRVAGVEAQLIARPITGLTLSLGATYLDSTVTDDFETFNSDGALLNANGSQLPFTPKVQAVADGEFNWSVGGPLQAFIGGNLTYHSEDNSSLATGAVPASEFEIRPYAVADFRAGVQSDDERWRLGLWVTNAFDKVHWNTVFRTIDDYFRYQARPRTFGLTFRYRYD